VIAIVSVPTALAPMVGGLLSRGELAIPGREEAEIGRTYFVVPLVVLAGQRDLFDHPQIEIQYFATYAEVYAWGNADIERRREAQRAEVRALVLAGTKRQREARR
jgi:hypothetical protein